MVPKSDWPGETYNDKYHAWLTLFSREVGCHQKNDDSYRNSGNGETKLNLADIDYNDQKLYSEPKEEEEIEFKEGNVNLVNRLQLLPATSRIREQSYLKG